MLRGRWTEENRAELEGLLARRFDYTPIAVFDWDQTCIRGDTADAVFHELCRDLGFKFEEPRFWDWVEEQPLETWIAECYEAYASEPTAERRAALRFELERTRYALHDSPDDNQAWAWDAGAFVGWTVREVREYTRRVIAREMGQPLGSEMLALEGMTLALERGLRVFPEIHELMYHLRRAGWKVAIISASPQWEVEAFAERYYIAPEQVVGMRRAVVRDRITAAIEPPVSWGDGKLDAFQLFVEAGRPPNFMAGDSLGDWKLLEWATDVALLIEPIHDALRNYATWRREQGEAWLLQEF